MKRETYLFFMPSDAEEFLCALAAVQGLFDEVAKRDIEPMVGCVCPNPDLSFLIATLGKLATPMCPEDIAESHLSMRDFDLVFKFDVARAKAIGGTTGRHMAEAFSILLGGAPKIFPDLRSVLDWNLEPAADILLLPFNSRLAFVDLIELNRCEHSMFAADDSKTCKDWLRLVSKARLVVGVRGLQTYLAACLNRRVIEIYPPSHANPGWLSKACNSNYRMVFAEDTEVSASFLYRVLEDLWPRSTLLVK